MDNSSIVILAWNIVVALAYGFDKMKARRGGRRVKESSLLTLAFLFGGAGAMFGMVLFNHKTSKTKFRFLVPLAVIVGAIALYWLDKTFILW